MEVEIFKTVSFLQLAIGDRADSREFVPVASVPLDLNPVQTPESAADKIEKVPLSLSLSLISAP